MREEGLTEETESLQGVPAEKENRLGTEPLGRLMVGLAVPTITAQLVNLLYNMVDRMYVGRIPGAGSMALAGLGVSFPIIVLISAFAALVGMGGAPQAGICLGKKDVKGAERILGSAITFLAILAIVLSVLFYSVKEPLLMMFGASENTIYYANEYLSIYLLGTIAVQFSMGLNQFITCQGFTKISMMTVMIGAVLNIILDPILIFGLQMGVRGSGDCHDYQSVGVCALGAEVPVREEEHPEGPESVSAAGHGGIKACTALRDVSLYHAGDRMSGAAYV